MLREIFSGLDRRVALVLLTSTFVLVALHYGAIAPVFLNQPRPIPTSDLQMWALMSFGAYFVIPALIVRLALGCRLRDFGLTLSGFLRHLPLYGGLYLLMVPVIWIASRQEEFLLTYPFAATARNGFGPLVTWELFYGLQFFALEFFFRGFMLFGLEERFGRNAIFVMVVPYCMLHFFKPFPETMGAVGAGVALGIIALRTRSIFGGVLIHWSVAITMDVMAIQASGGFQASLTE